MATHDLTALLREGAQLVAGGDDADDTLPSSGHPRAALSADATAATLEPAFGYLLAGPHTLRLSSADGGGVRIELGAHRWRARDWDHAARAQACALRHGWCFTQALGAT